VGGIVRRTFLWVAVITVCFAMRTIAQQPSSHSTLGQALRLRTLSLRPAPANAPHTPPVLYDATVLGSPLTLDKGWRVGVTTDPAASSADFDDSTWAVRDATVSFPDIDDEDQSAGSHSAPDSKTIDQKRFVWFRLHIKLAPNHGPLALLINLPVSKNTSMSFGSGSGPGPEVFVDGRQIQPSGPHSDAPDHYAKISRIYELNLSPSQTSMTLVVRTLYIPVGYGSYTSFFGSRTLFLAECCVDLLRPPRLPGIGCVKTSRAAATA
jgi:hypothetical protein